MSSARRPPPDPGLVVVDKPSGMTSHDVVARLRRILGTRKIGHAGTLDPMATGVLVCGVERATKLLGHLPLDRKAYLSTIRLGSSTHTDDAQGEVTSRADASGLADAAVLAGVATLTGAIEQVPSAVSAIKVAGKRAYTLVRDGVQVELPARPVTVFRFDVLATRPAPDDDPAAYDLDVLVECSSGTYVRALARDLGDGLGVGGHLTALRRSAVGPFGLAAARTLDQLDAAPGLSVGLDDAVRAAFEVRSVDDADADRLAHGAAIAASGLAGTWAAVDGTGRTIALLVDDGDTARPVLVTRPAS